MVRAPQREPAVKQMRAAGIYAEQLPSLVRRVVKESNARRIRIAQLEMQRDELLAALKEVERHCPCGARPESPHTHPHVLGCPVGTAIAKVEGAE